MRKGKTRSREERQERKGGMVGRRKSGKAKKKKSKKERKGKETKQTEREREKQQRREAQGGERCSKTEEKAKGNGSMGHQQQEKRERALTKGRSTAADISFSPSPTQRSQFPAKRSDSF